MLRALEIRSTHGIFQKHRLENILGVFPIFQMNPADPPNGVGIAVNRLTDLFLAAHHITPFLQTAASLRPPPHSPPACALIVADTIAICTHIPPAGTLIVTNTVTVCIYPAASSTLMIADAIVVFICPAIPCTLVVANTVAVCIHIPPTGASPACGPNRAASRKNHCCCQCSCQNLFHFLCLLSHILCVG